MTSVEVWKRGVRTYQMKVVLVRSGLDQATSKKTKTYIIDHHRRKSHEFRRLSNTEYTPFDQRALTPSTVATKTQVSNSMAASNLKQEPMFVRISEKNKQILHDFGRHQPQESNFSASNTRNPLIMQIDKFASSENPQLSPKIQNMYNSPRTSISHPLEKYLESENWS